MESSILSNFIQVQTANLHYLEAGDSNHPPLLLLHGASFSAQTWKDLGTLKRFSNQGYRVIALDLPGYGKSDRISTYQAEVLPKVFEKLNLTGAILVSPSMSGTYSLPFLVEHTQQLQGFVAVAPVGIMKMSQKLKGILLPTLAIWGSEDQIIPLEHAELLVDLMPFAQKIILPKVGHACYMKATNKFHEALLKFTKKSLEV
ncbi:MAG: alpha/beta hydrolase [Microcoleaceae cyanobacterium]